MKHKTRLKAIFQALFVTFLWSTSWVLIKIGLQTDLPAVTFAGLRYTIAFLCLLPLVLINPKHRKAIRSFSHASWLQLLLLGFLFYSITQGAQYISLEFLPAATLSLLLNFSPIFVALGSGLINKEPPSIVHWGGILFSTIGAMVYFFPLEIQPGQVLGLAIGFVCVLANAGSSLVGRQVNQKRGLSPILVTVISMGFGGLLLLVIGLTTQGIEKLSITHWLIVTWLAIVNTAVAFTWWNNSLRILTAVESSILNSTMLPQIAILAWLFLDEPLNGREIIGIILVSVGALVVQLRRNPISNRER